MEFCSNLLTYFLLLLIPIYCAYRILRNKYIALLNPSLHLVFWAYVYLTVPVLFMKSYSLYNFFNFSDQIYITTSFLCNWYVVVFWIFYMISTDHNIEVVNYRPKITTYHLALFFSFAISVFFVFLIGKFGPTLLSLSDRGSALSFFSDKIFFGYKFGIFFNVFLGSVAVILWRTRNPLWLLMFLLPISIDLLAKGRTIAWSCLFFAYLNYVFIFKKTAFKIAIPLFVGLVFGGFLRYKEYNWNQGIDKIFIDLFSDPIVNRFSTPLVYKDHFGEGNLFSYFIFSFFKILPESFTRSLFDYNNSAQVSLGHILTQDYGRKLGYSISVNIVGEALYYGGITFAIISPLLIGLIIYSLYDFRIYRNFPGFIFVCIVISGLRGTMRGTFYDTFMPAVYLMFSYLIWITILEWKSVVFRFKNNS